MTPGNNDMHAIGRFEMEHLSRVPGDGNRSAINLIPRYEMAILKSVLFVAAIGTVVCAAQDSEREASRAAALDQATTPGSADIDIHAEVAVVGSFAGFFDVTLCTTLIEDGTVVHTDLETGKIALLLEGVPHKPAPVDQSIGFDGMFVLDRNKFPLPIKLTAQQREQHNSFNVSLSGISDSESVGIATVDGEAIMIRLIDDGPGTTVLKLRRQSSVDKPTEPAAEEHIDHDPAKPYVPDGSA